MLERKRRGIAGSILLLALLVSSLFSVPARAAGGSLANGALSIPMRAPYQGAVDEDTVEPSFGAPPMTYRSEYVTSVKDQNPYGTCSFYATISAVESNVLRQGLAAPETLDLSEYQLFYFVYHRVVDPLKGTTGDKTVAKKDPLDGGNIFVNGLHLLTWSGVTKEKKVKKEFSYSYAKLKKALAYSKDAYHLQDMVMQPMSDHTAIKELIQKYGSVAVTYYNALEYVTQTDCPYYNAETAAYCYTGEEFLGNHAITLVGWNDKYSRANFREENRPMTDGAWLARNQWGTEFGKEGYFWISYEDTTLHVDDDRNCNLAVAYRVEKASNYKYNYQYDGGTYMTYWGPGMWESLKSITAANVYKVSGAAKQSLRAVGFGTFTDNVKYSIQIYKNPRKGKPKSGKKLLPKAQTGTFKKAGFYTVKLKKKPTLKKGDTFAVVVTIKSSAGDATLLADGNFDSEDFKMVSKQKKNQCYLIQKKKAYDTYAYHFTPRIKAYTRKK